MIVYYEVFIVVVVVFTCSLRITYYISSYCRICISRLPMLRVFYFLLYFNFCFFLFIFYDEKQNNSLIRTESSMKSWSTQRFYSSIFINNTWTIFDLSSATFFF